MAQPFPSPTYLEHLTGYVRDEFLALYAQLEGWLRLFTTISAGIYQGSAQTLTHDTAADITFAASAWDQGGLWTPTKPTLLTVPPNEGGVFNVVGQVTLAANFAGVLYARIKHNGTVVAEAAWQGNDLADTEAHQVSAFVDCAAQDTLALECEIQKAVGSGTQATVAGKASTFLHATKVRDTSQVSGGGAQGVSVSTGGGLSAPVDATDIGDGSVDNTEFGYLNGVTASIQTAINLRVRSISRTITDAEMKAATTPIEFIAAPGAGRVIVVLGAYWRANITDNGGTSVNLSARYNTDNQLVINAASVVVNGVNGYRQGFAAGTAFNTQDAGDHSNKAIEVLGSANAAAGYTSEAGVRYTLFYIDLATS